MIDDKEQEQEQEQDQEQRQREEEQEEKAEERRRQVDVQIREQEESDWSVTDRAAKPDSYLVEAAARARPNGKKSLILYEDDLNAELFCGFSLKQLKEMQEADPE